MGRSASRGLGGVGVVVESQDAMSPRVPSADFLQCDGCWGNTPIGEITFVLDLGHECRYCRECSGVYDSWMASVAAMEARLQAELDAWQHTMRPKVALKILPSDFPPVRRPSLGDGLLRLA